MMAENMTLPTSGGALAAFVLVGGSSGTGVDLGVEI